MTQITQPQYKALVDEIYSTIMTIQTTHPETGETIEMGMGEMGDAEDEAKRIVDDWMKGQGITFDDDASKLIECYPE